MIKKKVKTKPKGIIEIPKELGDAIEKVCSLKRQMEKAQVALDRTFKKVNAKISKQHTSK